VCLDAVTCNVGLNCVDSDIISLNLAGDTVIVLNSLAATDALLEERSAIYSDRYVALILSSPLPINIPKFISGRRSRCSMICKLRLHPISVP
jgi:hypothetical protein